MSVTTVGKDRIRWIDALKGFAMCLVILGHITEKYYKFNLYPSSTGKIGVVFNLIYSFHMPLFMMISGYLFDKAYFDQNGELKGNRLKFQFFNFLIVYILFSLLEGGVKLVFSRDVISPVTPVDFALILFKPMGGRMWYLYVLLEYYILFSRKPMQKRIGSLPLLIVISVLSILSVFMSYDWWFSCKRAFRDMLPFYVGILLDRFGIEKIAKNRIFEVLSIIVIGIRMVLYLRGITTNEIPVISVIYGVLIAIWIFTVFQNIEVLSKLRGLIAVGVVSLEMFIFQEYPLTMGTKILPRIIGVAWLSIVLCFVFTIFIVLIGTMTMKKIRLHGVFFKPYTQMAVKRKMLDEV